MKYCWDSLSPLQVGRYSEYYCKMEFTLHGTEVYTSEVDDRGIDFVVKVSHRCYLDVQVKSVRFPGTGYIFFKNDKFELRPNLFAAIVLLTQGEEPKLYLIPSLVWRKPDGIFVDRAYEGRVSKPEYGLNVSHRALNALERHRFEATLGALT